MTEKIILASASPRRSQLLQEAGIRFEVIPSQVKEDEYKFDNISAVEYTRILAKAKALDIAVKNPSRLVLGADCVVSIDNHIIGKPKNEEDAAKIIKLLFSKPHDVITSVSFIAINNGIELMETESTTVYPKNLTQKQIDDFIASGKWQGKAGGYGIQDPETDDFIDSYEGSYTNVMGMPMETVTEIIDEIFDRE
ncbi:MAG: Maf family protein [Sedimentisphaeraceae bacterium JB056]